MITLNPTTDSSLIKSAITHPSVWPWASDDGSPSIEAFEPRQDAIYLACWDESEDVRQFLGVFMFSRANAATVEVHTCLLPSSWGQRAKDCAKAARQWIWDNTSHIRIVSSVPANNRHALKFAKDSGMSEWGFNPGAWIKGGEVFGVHMVGCSKEDSCQQQ